MDEIVFLIGESPEGGYEARGLGHDISTGADTLEELREALRDAVICHFEEGNRPRLVRLHMMKDEIIAV